MTETESQVWGCFGLLLAFVISLVVGTIAKGWALATLWGWFAVPVFELRPLGIIEAIGLSMIVSFLTVQYGNETSSGKKDTLETIGRLVGWAILYPVFAVCVGWVVFQFM